MIDSELMTSAASSTTREAPGEARDISPDEAPVHDPIERFEVAEAPAAKRKIQRVIQKWHHRLFDRGLPTKLGLYFHGLEEEHYRLFESAILCLRGLGYRIAPDIESYLANPTEQAAWISFDDNYQSWYRARALFDDLDIRATFYTNTSVFRDRTPVAVRRDFFDRIDHPGEPLAMSTDELVALRGDGHTIGAHTHTHPVLSKISIADAQEEIRVSQEILQEILQEPIRHFAYPYGLRRYFDDRLIDYCKSIGIETIARAIPAMQHADEEPYELHRSGWRYDRDAYRNVRDLAVAGHWFERLTGRSAVG